MFNIDQREGITLVLNVLGNFRTSGYHKSGYDTSLQHIFIQHESILKMDHLVPEDVASVSQS